MLTLPLAMKSVLFTLVFTVIIIHCQSITVRDDESVYDVTPKTYVYPDSDTKESEAGYRQEEFYNPLSRTYQYEDSNQDTKYIQSQSEQNTENYLLVQRDRQTGRRRPVKKQYVEQYLKEVTPTTKTTYQRPENVIRLNGQNQGRGTKESDGLKQYFLQSELQQKPQRPQIQYVIPEQKVTQHESPSATLTAYRNALLAHQKVLETEDQDETSKSSVYVTHSIPKKPVRKIVKPTEDDAQQYRNLQQYEVPQKQFRVYERQQPAQVLYQAKAEYPNRDAEVQASTEIPAYQNEKILKHQQLTQEIQNLLQQQISTEQRLPSQQLISYQQILSNRQVKPVKQLFPGTAYKNPTKSEEASTFFQYEQPQYLKKGPKYLPEPKSPRYQVDETEEKYQQEVSVPAQQPLTSYQEAIAKLQAEKFKIRTQQLRPQYQVPVPQYQEQDSQTVGYTLQLQNENQDAGTEYVRVADTDKYRLSENAADVAYRQPQNGIRYYRNPGRSAPVSYSQYK